MKKVVVTGASKGIGRAIALKLLQAGKVVIGTSRDPDSIDIQQDNFMPVHLDLRQVVENDHAAVHFSQHCGDVDAIILNAGGGRFGGLEEFSRQQMIAQMQQNLLAQMILAREFVTPFRIKGGGDMVFIGSESALKGAKMGSVYSAAKFGLRGFSQALRAECAAKNIRVSLINPGMVASEFFEALSFCPGEDPANSILPEQVADAVWLVLASERNVIWDEINLSPRTKVIIKKPKLAK